MYEAILNHLDAFAAAIGLGAENRQVLPGVNPWGYTNGVVVEKQTSNRISSSSTTTTSEEKEANTHATDEEKRQ